MMKTIIARLFSPLPLREGLGVVLLLLVGSASLQAQSDPFPDISTVAYKYQGSMTCTTQVVMNGEIVTDAVVAAYCGDDFRGKNNTGKDPGHPNHVNLTIYGDDTGDNQYLHFKVFTQGKVFTCNPTPVFLYTFYGSVGSTANPYIIDITPVSLANDADNTATLTTYKDETCDVVLTGRTLYKDGDWNTICLPFGLTTEQIAASPLAGATVMELDNSDKLYDCGNGVNHATGLDNGTLYLNFTIAYDPTDAPSGSIVADTPYIIRWDKASDYDDDPTVYDISNPVFTNVTITSTAPTPVEFAITNSNDKCQFVGQYSPIKVTEANRYIMLGSSNYLGYVAVNKTLRPFRAHFEVPAGTNVKAYKMNFGEEGTETGIISLTEMNNEQGKVKNEADAWYDMSGRKLEGKPNAKGIYINNGRKIIVK